MDAAGYKADGKARRVIVTGCLAQRYAGELASELPEVRASDGLPSRGADASPRSTS